jgi:hypothetical protein
MIGIRQKNEEGQSHKFRDVRIVSGHNLETAIRILDTERVDEVSARHGKALFNRTDI